MNQSIKHNENDSRGVFLIESDNGIISELTYSKDRNGIMTIDHTETKRGEEGKGYAGKLVEHAVAYARKMEYKIDPLCPFAEVKFDEHPEYQDVRS
ncbi:GNAT family N-acetyltransferase [Flavimarina sp. Hel_I_48]|uniref:GNAT family N-acetyltransferase n=1 Tax=Flavimarina sp. Hel_I_48 TaxID=1392488 RepID=UPI0004DF1F6C|nr:GNAT family N-acetyltransferase [Flavimarina sp. Hel_I_48]